MIGVVNTCSGTRMSVFRSSLTDMRQTIAVGCAQVTVIHNRSESALITGHGFTWVAKRRTVVPLIPQRVRHRERSEAIHWRRNAAVALDRHVPAGQRPGVLAMTTRHALTRAYFRLLSREAQA